MSRKKKNHHITPKTYLNGFISGEIPEKYSDLEKITPGLYCLDKDSLQDWEFISPGNKKFTISYAYKLSDSKNENFVEDSLANIESKYNTIVKKIKSRGLLSGNECIQIEKFIISMMMRTEHQLNIIDARSRKISYLADKYQIEDRLVNIGEITDKSKKSILDCPEIFKNFGLAKVLINTGKLPFITSDSPVIYINISSKNALSLGLMGSLSDIGITPSLLMPVSPTHMLVMTNDWERYSVDNIYHEFNSEKNICHFNYLQMIGSHRFIFSHTENPFSNESMHYIDYIHNLNKNSDEFKFIINIKFECGWGLSVKSKELHRINDGILLKFPDVLDYLNVANRNLESVHIYNNDNEYIVICDPYVDSSLDEDQVLLINSRIKSQCHAEIEQ